MAEFSPVLSVRDGGGRFAQPIFPRSRSGSESESELSQSLARTKIRSYGSTASVTASLGEKYIEHRVTDSDTLQGIALKYGVTVSWPHDHCRINILIFTLTSSTKWLLLIKSITDPDRPNRHAYFLERGGLAGVYYTSVWEKSPDKTLMWDKSYIVDRSYQNSTSVFLPCWPEQE